MKLNKKTISTIVTCIIAIIYILISEFGEVPSVVNIYNDFEIATVVKHTDGDTIHVEINGEVNKVRFIGVNTPESTNKTEYYGKEASEYTKEMLYIGRVIYLEKDVSDVDKYNRLLRYIWLEQPNEINEQEIRNKMYNANLVLEGYAEAKEYKPDVKYSSYFKEYQKEAEDNNKGMWNN